MWSRIIEKWLKIIYKMKEHSRKINIFIFVLLIIVILWITLFSREIKDRNVYLIPFGSYIHVINGDTTWIIENLENILMFIPFGLLLQALLYNGKRVVIFGFVFSLLIELIQYNLRLGCFETDDLIHNTLGVLIGVLFLKGIKLVRRNEGTGRKI